MEFSEKMRFVPGKFNMSKEELAQALNVSYASIHRWENAKSKPLEWRKRRLVSIVKNI